MWARARESLARLFGGKGEQPNGGAPERSDREPLDFSASSPFSQSPGYVEPLLSEANDTAASMPVGGLPLLERFDTVEEALPISMDAAAAEVPTPSTASEWLPDQAVSAGDASFHDSPSGDTDPLLQSPASPAMSEETQEVARPPGLFARLFRRQRLSVTEDLAPPVVDEANPGFLVAEFRAFYNEILLHKHQGSEISAGFATAIVSREESTGDSPEQAASSLSARLQQMLELQQAKANWVGGEAAARYPDAQYAMAVLADETLSTVDWKGREAWPQFSLEQKLYQSSAADLEFFKRVDRLFKEGPSTRVSRDLARVYLLTLAAGFRGKYGAFGLTRALHEYRQRLFEYIHGGDALLLYGEDRVLFPDVRAHTIVGRPTARISGAQRWVAVLVILLGAYAVAAHVAWNRASADLRDVTGRVEAATATPSLAGAPR